ncbi:MAG: GNAT family N-acetyltransferase [Deltaproteobacteria bacterium]|nr:GNAT family N-acetyltransferase [Deltaproteobacteria bacterium]
MKIRIVKQSDFSEWHRLREMLFTDCESDELLLEINAIYFDRNVVGELDYFVCVVENDETKLCGFCETSLRISDPLSQGGPVGYVESLYVESKYRMKGLAKGMLFECENWVRNKNCLDLWVDTEDRYSEALMCYENFGFTVIKRTDSGILLKKNLR